MRKGLLIGIGVAVLVFSIMAGIASLPDEVLTEYSSTENTKNLPLNQDEKNLDDTQPIGEIKTSGEEPEILEEEPEILEEEPGAETQGRKIEVKISDGVGAGDR